MTDISHPGPTLQNLRTLIYFMGLIIDSKLEDMRAGGPYAHVRPSDVRVFVAATRGPATISELARLLLITRQSVQMSVKRLLKLGVVEMVPVPGNQRDKHVVLTQRGVLARGTAGNQIAALETEFSSAIGPGNYEVLRQSLIALVDTYKSKVKKGITQLA